MIDWGEHLGEDCIRPADTKVKSIGRGKVLYAGYHPGNLAKRNWGGLVIVGHYLDRIGTRFCSLYGHLKNIVVKKYQIIENGQLIGEIASASSEENGWWEDSHLHWAIYIGPWKGDPLVGYWREDQNYTKREFWLAPTLFIDECNRRCAKFIQWGIGEKGYE